jgi:hypothetical protein
VNFKIVRDEFFPGAIAEQDFIARTHAALVQLGFTRDNTIACACVCRDEIAQPLVARIHGAWGEAFNLASLGGMFFAGATALRAAIHHAPNPGGRERYIFYALAHIAISDQGKPGVCQRAGRTGGSIACGALDAFQKELASGTFSLMLDKQDVEYSLIKERLARETLFGQHIDLIELTKLAQKASQRDLENAVQAVVNPAHSDYAIATGIQIHGPSDNYVWRADFYAVIHGIKRDLGG